MGAPESNTTNLYGFHVRESANDGSDFSNAAADYRVLFLGEDGGLHLRDSAGAITMVGIGAGSANPSNPNTNDRFYRTDLGLFIYYDGTRWLTTTLFSESMAEYDGAINAGRAAAGGTQNAARWSVPAASTLDLYIVRCEATSFVSTTNDGSNFWTVRWRWGNAAGTFTNIDTFATSGDTASNYVFHTETVGSVLDNTAVTVSLDVVPTNSPGVIIIAGTRVVYRLVIT